MSVLNYKHLEWDSEFFNYKVAEIRLNTTTEPLLLETISELKKQNYSLIYLFLDNKVNFENKLFSIKLVDEKKTYLKNIDEQNIYFNDIILYNFDFANSELIELAIESGIYSRFNLDEKIENSKFENLYEQWIVNSVNKKIAKEILICEQENAIAGMITLGVKNERGDIGIIAVNKNFRGKNIASKLISSAELYFKNIGYSEIQVVTQGVNIPACNLYEKNGFSVYKTEFVYHIWL